MASEPSGLSGPSPDGPPLPGRADRHGLPTVPGIPIPPGASYRPVQPMRPPPEVTGAPPHDPAVPPPVGEPPAVEGDPFTLAEHHTRAAVTGPWWAGAAPAHRRQVLAPHLLMLPDLTWWTYGAWARWYRWHPSDGRWVPCPPPGAAAARRSAVPVGPGTMPPPVPAEILPAAHDAGPAPWPPRAVAGQDVPDALADRLRQVVTQAALTPAADYPLAWNHFLHGTPSTIAATWSTMVWCASVPLFDSEAENDLLGLWKPYLAHPVGGPGRLRWLMPPPLRTIAGLYAERLRAGRPDAASQIARNMLMTAQAVRDDQRFEPKASALQAILEPVLEGPGIDHPAIPYGDQAMERHWSMRCPPALAPTLFADTAPGPGFQLALYDLAEAVRPLCGDPEDADFVEPRHAAVALLAADLEGYRPDLATPIGEWLDPETRGMLAAVLREPGHRLRALWPSRGRPPEPFRPADAEEAAAVLGAAAAVDFAWCRLVHDIPIPAGGFAVPGAYAATLGELRGTSDGVETP
ncbi:hypothetical protein [Actinomadura alba]|uniref:Uncharacterized protein n=1 Tax=Actinomadura alba TaxID=406431 RepID=A0ABR7LYD4_9ACTN|nr:hypothetical protein [Actinomadura alba]MBC6469791.1 hypothetical protein [Actinomadura alba]